MDTSIHETTTHRTHNGQTVCFTPARATHAAYRKAFGPGKSRTPAQKAADVAASIAMRHDRGAPWTWDTYGLQDQADQQVRVEAALAALEGTREEEARLQAWHYEEEYARLEDWERLEELEVHGRW